MDSREEHSEQRMFGAAAHRREARRNLEESGSDAITDGG